MGDLAALAIIVAAAYATGAGLLALAPRLVLDTAPRRVAFRLAVGLGALAYTVLLVGVLGLLRPAVGWGLVAAGLAAGAPVLWRELRRRAVMRRRTAETPVEFVRDERWPHALPGGAWPRVLSLAVLAVVAVLTLQAALVALAPPREFDELTYHLAAPKVYLERGRVEVLPYDHHTAFPFTLEMLYTLGLLLGGPGTAKLLHTAYWLLTLLAVDLGRDYFGPRTGWLAVLCYACTPLAFYQAGLAYTEFGFACYQLLALIAFLEYLNTRATGLSAQQGRPLAKLRQPAWIGLAGLLAGLTAGVKLTGGLVALFLVAACVVLGLRQRLRTKALVLDCVTLLLVSGLVAAPWLIRSWAATGNPVFPFAHGVFHSPKWSADRAAIYDEAQREFGRALNPRLQPVEPGGAQRAPLRLLTAPWHLTFHPDWFYDRGLNFDYKASPGPAYLAFALPALLAWLMVSWRRRREAWAPYEEVRAEEATLVYSPEFRRKVPVARAREIIERVTLPTPTVAGLLVAYLAFVGLFWFATMQHARYLVPHLALAAALAAWGADGMLRLPVSAVAAGVVLALQTAAGLSYGVTASYPALRYHLGSLPEPAYIGLPVYTAMQWINQATPPDATVITYGEPRDYYLDREYLWGERGHHTLIPDEVRGDPAAYVRYLRDELGVDYALVYEPVFPTTRTEGEDDIAVVTRAIAAGLLRPVYQEPQRGVVVYRVES